MTHYEAIVLGTGGMGSAALYQLAKRGCRVLGLDRFSPPHGFGSSHGQSRIIRQAYFEHPNYTPLLLEAYQHWSKLAAQLKSQLYHEVGVLEIGPLDGVVVPGVLKAAEMHNLSVEQLTSAEIQQRWPALRVPQDLCGVYEPRAGYLLVEQCVEAYLHVAQEAGAALLNEVEVNSWQPGPPVTLQSSAGEFAADRLIVTAGAWAGSLLKDLNLGLAVLRKSLFWFPSGSDCVEQHEQLPCFLYELPNGVFYGMPQIDQRGVKVAEHSRGQPISDPLVVNRQVDPADAERMSEFVQRQLPGLSQQAHDHAVCLYTMSPDQHFIVDRHPEHSHVVFAAGLSGHGFKFAPVLGQAMTELALDGRTQLPIEFLARR